MTLIPRQFLAALIVAAVALMVHLTGITRAWDGLLPVLSVFGPLIIAALGGGGQLRAWEELPSALGMIKRGHRPTRPEHAPAALVRTYDEMNALADALAQEQDARRLLVEVMNGLRDGLERAVEGRPPVTVPVDLGTEHRRMFDRVEQLARQAQELAERTSARGGAASHTVQGLETSLAGLREALVRRMQAVQEANVVVMDLTTAAHDFARHLETLSATAEQASANILQLTGTTDQVSGGLSELGSSVRETASSIEEMAYSIKEVAKNVDALSLTAEETSSSMNQMDVSIDQVQSNANETARLSEDVSRDAERGAEAILKTIGEIYRIKESTQEAVAVISNLGSRIDAIGQILNVIDDVAEQTNLLALNAAIIAAQAGEHGKGFAVVADEIKDLAERAGASTKEIAELTRTIQAESRNAIAAVERGAKNVDRGVAVSNDAEQALKQILDSSQKSTNMVRAIARATVEQAKGSRQVTDAIGRIAETVQQIAAATTEQAKGSEVIMHSSERMRVVTEQVERSGQEQSRDGRQVAQAIESIANLAGQLSQARRSLTRSSELLTAAVSRMEAAGREEEGTLRDVGALTAKLRDIVGA